MRALFVEIVPDDDKSFTSALNANCVCTLVICSSWQLMFFNEIDVWQPPDLVLGVRNQWFYEVST